MLFTTAAHPQMLEYAHPNLGRLIQPRDYGRVDDTAAAGIPWAADNDAFNPSYSDEAFVRMLNRIAGLRGCRFVAAPDVVGDAEATAIRFDRWAPRIRNLGLPVALVLQDGQGPVPWDEVDAVFVGGTDRFKGSPLVAEIVAEAKQRGKWAHMGRVNSLRRINYAASIGCDSIDGTKFSKWRATYLAEGLAHVAAGRQLPLEEAA